MISQDDKITQSYELVKNLQEYFVIKLEGVANLISDKKSFKKIQWQRSGGKYGGGSRFVSVNKDVFNTASVNISGIDYSQDDSKQLLCANAISSIIHPQNPYMPSIHIHFSYTAFKNGKGYFRLMGDLNPSLQNSQTKKFKKQFSKALKKSTKPYYKEGTKQGDKYFYIPVLKRTRGIKHFYLENFSNDFKSDLDYTKKVATSIIDVYIKILHLAYESSKSKKISKKIKKLQLDYHTLYFLQVLTLDRGTTSGLLVHNENDIGIMGSLPTHVNKKLLKKISKKMPKPQDKLLKSLISCLDKKTALVDENVKQKLANAIRKHYKKYPKAIDMQASGFSIPPTVSNHKSKN